jgi:hypothetical protein
MVNLLFLAEVILVAILSVRTIELNKIDSCRVLFPQQRRLSSTSVSVWVLFSQILSDFFHNGDGGRERPALSKRNCIKWPAELSLSTPVLHTIAYTH